VRSVAFLRNVNQGQRGHPSTTEIADAFAAAGADEIELFQSNGTVLFAADDPEVVLDRAVAALAAASGHEREAYGMPLAELARIVDAHAAAVDAGRRELTLHGGGTIDLDAPDVVAQAARVRCVIVDAGPGWIVSTNERDRESNATPLAQRLTGTPATSRGLPTLVRLVDRHAR
jgi:uncharacterized protein (DUF1697 family)